jgi:predicted HAD superfamily Cof-like phosphohydrolase
MRYKSREDYVEDFMSAMGQGVNVSQPDESLLHLRYKLICEEVKELGEEIAYAMAESNFKEGIPERVKIRMLKELADCQYVISGLAVSLGLPLQEAFVRVHNSNMTKLGEDGKPVYREDGKIMKGKNYVPCNLEDLI